MFLELRQDLLRYTNNKEIGNIELLKLLFIRPAFKYVFIKRACNYYKDKNKILFSVLRVILKKYQIKYGLEIPYETEIGPGLYIGHIGGIVINGKSKIGKNVNILNGVLIGYEPRGKRKGCPVIGDEVWIGSNSVIVGNIEIGNNVLIAPNSFVNFNVPNNSIVIGNPARIIYKEKATEGYVNYKIQ